MIVRTRSHIGSSQMPMLLYDREGLNKDRLNQPGQKLHKDTTALIRPLLMEYRRAGFSTREIAHIMTHAIEALETEGVLRLTE
jgi:hypothetical protein